MEIGKSKLETRKAPGPAGGLTHIKAILAMGEPEQQREK
jgi:hypothetical protein